MSNTYIPQFEDFDERGNFEPGASLLGRHWKSSDDVIEAITRGLSAGAYKKLDKVYMLMDPKLNDVVSIKDRTLHTRLIKGGVFTDLESERIYRFARILELAASMFGGDTKEAAQWLAKPAPAFDGEAPIRRVNSEFGAREVENLIYAMREGVFI